MALGPEIPPAISQHVLATATHLDLFNRHHLLLIYRMNVSFRTIVARFDAPLLLLFRNC